MFLQSVERVQIHKSFIAKLQHASLSLLCYKHIDACILVCVCVCCVFSCTLCYNTLIHIFLFLFIYFYFYGMDLGLQKLESSLFSLEMFHIFDLRTCKLEKQLSTSDFYTSEFCTFFALPTYDFSPRYS